MKRRLTRAQRYEALLPELLHAPLRALHLQIKPPDIGLQHDVDPPVVLFPRGNLPRARAEYALDRVFNAAHFLCDHGPVLKDGETFGLSASEKIRISHRPSRWERSPDVIFLELPVESR
jgi:hypothetical protein